LERGWKKSMDRVAADTTIIMAETKLRRLKKLRSSLFPTVGILYIIGAVLAIILDFHYYSSVIY
jgi:hypothetical protein